MRVCKGQSRMALSFARLILVLLLVLAVAPVQAQDDGIRLPDIGASAGAVISERDENAYGEALKREFTRLAKIVDDPLIAGYFRLMGYSLVAHSDRPDGNFTFVVVDDDSINAFAAPGGFIALHSQLILTAENESEVAAVVAHEIAHVTQRHIARRIESAQKMSLPMTLLMLGAVLAGSGNGDAAQAAVVGTQALMQQMQINFTRANEYEADWVGIRKLAAAGYDPDAMASFFAKMARENRGYGARIPEFLRTHPVESTRIAESKNRARQVTVEN
ncbi:MAG: M48 family metalloprotease, partial [Pseudomonadota bacterium]